jgi:predicted DNA-binding protein
MVKKSNNWNLQEMQDTLVKDTEQRISDGFQEIASASAEPKPTENVGGEKHQPSDIIHHTSSVSPQTSEQEPQARPQKPVKDIKHMGDVKGVQTYITLDDYQRLSYVKIRRGGTIANLVAEAIELWLDVQEGKQKVSATI